MDSARYEKVTNSTDSYGNTYTNALTIKGRGKVTFNLNRKFSSLSFNIAVSEHTPSFSSDFVNIIADDKTIYTSEMLDIYSEPLKNIDISIDNCSLLTIEISDQYDFECIISDAIVYN